MKSSAERVIVLHGTKGSATGNWFPWLTEQLAERGVPTLVPQLPTPAGQSLRGWQTAFADAVGDVGSESVIIGHSNGAAFLLRLLEQVREPIRCAVFVAGFCGRLGLPEYDELNSTFVDGQFDWPTIVGNAPARYCLIGDDDPYVPRAQAMELADQLQVTPKIVSRGGHLNAEAGFDTFPLLLTLLEHERAIPEIGRLR